MNNKTVSFKFDIQRTMRRDIFL